VARERLRRSGAALGPRCASRNAASGSGWEGPFTESNSAGWCAPPWRSQARRWPYGLLNKWFAATFLFKAALEIHPHPAGHWGRTWCLTHQNLCAWAGNCQDAKNNPPAPAITSNAGALDTARNANSPSTSSQQTTRPRRCFASRRLGANFAGFSNRSKIRLRLLQELLERARRLPQWQQWPGETRPSTIQPFRSILPAGA